MQSENTRHPDLPTPDIDTETGRKLHVVYSPAKLR